MSSLTTVQVQSESKIKKIGQNWVYGEDLRSLTPKTKKWGNNHLSRRFGKYSFSQKNIENWRSPENDFCLVFSFLVFGYWVVQIFFFQ